MATKNISVKPGIVNTAETKRLNCDVPKNIYMKLRMKAVMNETSITEIVNTLVKDYVSR